MREVTEMALRTVGKATGITTRLQRLKQP